jgi:tetratricopeptide (TPR) repeat protein
MSRLKMPSSSGLAGDSHEGASRRWRLARHLLVVMIPTHDRDPMTIERDPVAAVAAASALWGEPERAEALLLQAMDDAPDSEVVLIALYRFYFYRSELSKALALAERCIEHGASDIGIDPDWRKVVASDVDFSDFSLPRHRFYLFSLNAYGYLLARLGRMEDSEQALSAVMRLDPNDRIGSAQLLGVVRAGPDQD